MNKKQFFIRLFIVIIALGHSKDLAFSQEQKKELTRLYFIDGFSVNLSEGYVISNYSLIEEGVSDDEGFTLKTPEGAIVDAYILYSQQNFQGNIKDVILFTARSFFDEVNTEELDEFISVLRYKTSKGLEGYWVNITLGESDYVLFAYDMRNAPGWAYVLFLLVRDDSLRSEVKESTLQGVTDNLFIEFMEAAG